jgi:hypothetical protein
VARVLNSIALTAPAAPVDATVNDQFTFTGTPGFTGSGGVQRYDMKWEVDAGAGFVTIAASGTGLTTASTNPLVNSNSATANSITVDCTDAGSYTIRISGAPTSGGSYTVVSSTQTVEVSAAAAPYVAELSAPAVAVSAQALTRFNAFVAQLSAPAVAFVAQVVDVAVAGAAYVAELSAPAFAMTGAALTRLNAYIAFVSAPAVAFTAQALTRFNAVALSLSVAAYGFVAYAVDLAEEAGDGINASYLFCRAALYRARRRGGG